MLGQGRPAPGITAEAPPSTWLCKRHSVWCYRAEGQCGRWPRGPQGPLGLTLLPKLPLPQTAGRPELWHMGGGGGRGRGRGTRQEQKACV